IAGRAISAIALSAHSACWKPPVSAAGTVCPACSSASVWVAATLEAIAIPIAPPRFWLVLSSPDASPARCSSTPARPAIEIGMNANAVPAPATTNGANRFPTNRPWTGTCVAQITPAPISVIPTAITSLAEVRVTRYCERPASATDVTDVASQRTESVKPTARRRLKPALRHESRDERQRGRPDRDVQVEDVLPPGIPGQQSAGDQPHSRAAGGDRAPDPERLVALRALPE